MNLIQSSLTCPDIQPGVAFSNLLFTSPRFILHFLLPLQTIKNITSLDKALELILVQVANLHHQFYKDLPGQSPPDDPLPGV